MNRLLTASAIVFAVACTSSASAKKCPDGKYRPVCPARGTGTSNRPMFMPMLGDFIGRPADYRTALVNYRQQLDHARQAGTISQAEYQSKAQAQADALQNFDKTHGR